MITSLNILNNNLIKFYNYLNIQIILELESLSINN